MRGTGFRWSALGAVMLCGSAWLAGPARSQQFGMPYGQAHTGVPAAYDDAIEEARSMVAEVMKAGGIPPSHRMGVNGEIVGSQGFGLQASSSRGRENPDQVRNGSTSKPNDQAAANPA